MGAPAPSSDPALRRVGRVIKAHGIRGELTVEPSTDSPEVRFAVGASLSGLTREGETRVLTIAATRPHSGRLLVRFEEALTREAAEGLRGVQLFARVADLPPTDDPDEFYDHELEGLIVSTVRGDPIGTLREVLHGAAGDLLVVAGVTGDEVLVPFVREIVTEVDVAGGQVRIDPPPGLLEDGDS